LRGTSTVPRIRSRTASPPEPRRRSIPFALEGGEGRAAALEQGGSGGAEQLAMEADRLRERASDGPGGSNRAHYPERTARSAGQATSASAAASPATASMAAGRSSAAAQPPT
jgi:hypothetical protein